MHKYTFTKEPMDWKGKGSHLRTDEGEEINSIAFSFGKEKRFNFPTLPLPPPTFFLPLPYLVVIFTTSPPSRCPCEFATPSTTVVATATIIPLRNGKYSTDELNKYDERLSV